MENGIHPWYSSTHVIHPPMEFTHGIVNGIDPWYSSTHDIYSPIRPWYCKWPMVCIHPWYSSTHGIYPWYCKWYLPMVLAHGIHLWYCISKKAINNKPHFVKGQIFCHNVASKVILCFNKTSFFVVLFSLCSLFFSGIIILQILSDIFQIFRSWGLPPQYLDHWISSS